MNAKRMIVAVSCAVLVTLALPARECRAGDPEWRSILDYLLQAVEANDYDSFVKLGTDAFKAGLTKPMLTSVSGQLAPRLKKGYSVEYLGELKQQGYPIHLWKISYKDGGDDTLAKLVLNDGKVAGFWLQ